MEKKSLAAGSGSAVVAILSSSCCWLPLLLLAAGAGASSVGALTGAIERLRPLFAVVALGSLGTAWYLTYFRGRAGSPPGSREACCEVRPGAATRDATCSCCGRKGKRVPGRTVRALVHETLRGDVVEGGHVLCLNPACAQVYTGPSGARSFVKSDLAVRVGFKERDGPHIVCYCFGHGVENIEEELRASGATAIPDRIRAGIRAGRCACDVKNPQGACCLGNVNQAVKEARERIAGHPSAAIGAPAVQCAPAPSPEEDHAACCRLAARTASGMAAVRGVRRLNRVLLPILSVAVLGMVVFPHQIFALLLTSGDREPTVASSLVAGKEIVLRVPGMT